MAISNYALDTFVSQDLSKLTQVSIRSLADEFPSAENWFAQFVVRRIVERRVPDDEASLVFAIVRRTHAALDEWELARAAATGNLRIPAVYFRALRHVETCIGSVWQGLEFGRKALGQELFQKGDGTVYQRLNWIYNVSRHFDPEALAQGDLHRVWLTNDAVHTREQALTFEELRETIKMLARISERAAGA